MYYWCPGANPKKFSVLRGITVVDLVGVLVVLQAKGFHIIILIQ